LFFYRRYHTYQALLELHPKEELPDHACFSKAVLHVMQWIGKSIHEGQPGYRLWLLLPDDSLSERLDAAQK